MWKSANSITFNVASKLKSLLKKNITLWNCETVSLNKLLGDNSHSSVSLNYSVTLLWLSTKRQEWVTYSSPWRQATSLQCYFFDVYLITHLKWPQLSARNWNLELKAFWATSEWRVWVCDSVFIFDWELSGFFLFLFLSMTDRADPIVLAGRSWQLMAKQLSPSSKTLAISCPAHEPERTQGGQGQSKHEPTIFHSPCQHVSRFQTVKWPSYKPHTAEHLISMEN